MPIWNKNNIYKPHLITLKTHELIGLYYVHIYVEHLSRTRTHEYILVIPVTATSLSFNSLAPGRSGSDFKSIILEHMSRINSISTSCEIILRWMPQDTLGEKWISG